MRILIGMHHPKHFWMFKNLIKEGEKKGWKFKILISKKDVLEDLLKSSGLGYSVIGKNQPTKFRKILELIKYIYYTYRLSKKFKPDVYIGQALPHFGFISSLNRKPYYIFEDTEQVPFLHSITIPFCTNVFTPKCFKRNLGRKHKRINTFYELLYLHPNYFKPHGGVLHKYGLSKKDNFVIIRIVSWKALHDIGTGGLDNESIRKIIITVKNFAKPLITSEENILEEFDQYQLKINSMDIHHLLSFAKLYIGEGATMATEATMLGTPSIYINKEIPGNIIEQKDSAMIECFQNPRMDIKKITSKICNILGEENKSNYKKIRDKILKYKADPLKAIIDILENTPRGVIKK